jgi:hypothetical protein
MGLVGHVVRMGQIWNAYTILLWKSEKKKRLEDLCSFEKGNEPSDFIQGGDQCGLLNIKDSIWKMFVGLFQLGFRLPNLVSVRLDILENYFVSSGDQ